MDVSSSRIWTTSRVVAVTIIGLLLVGLSYMRFASEAGSMDVPEGAEAGDLTLEPCDYETEAGIYQADCGTLVVRENSAESEAKLIALPVTRIRATSDQPGEPIFRLDGGPGMSNMGFPEASRFAESHDVVLVGYRGVDGSVRLDCPEVEAALGRSRDFLGKESLDAYSDGLRSCADRLTEDGVDLTMYGLVQQVDDMETARQALGYDRIDLVSVSAGTRTAMIYAWRYPDSIHRSVMINVNPPGNLFWDGKSTDEQIQRYAELCTADATCSGRTSDLTESLQLTSAEIPDRWLFLPIKEGNVRVGSFFALMESTAVPGPVSASGAFDAWIAAADGDGSGLWLLSTMGDLVYPRLFAWGQYASAARVDAEAAEEYFTSGGQEVGTNLGRAASAFAWGGGRLVDAWPAAAEENRYSQVQLSEVETLLVSGELDAATPPQVVTDDLLPYLPNGHHVILDGFAHSPGFWKDQPEAGTRLITTFFDSGTVDDSGYRPQPVDFSPETTLGALSTQVVSVLLALGVLTVLCLIWMARRASQGKPFGPVSEVVLRTLLPVALGLGGWSIAVLGVSASGLRLPLDHALVVILAVGLPIGLGVYLASVRSWSNARGSAVSIPVVGAALLGATVGFGATASPPAIATAIVGAIAAANLALILLALFRDRAGRSRAVAPPVDPTVQRVGAPEGSTNELIGKVSP
jgi:pimeloyl-ACP methyl ester carboxylesterase